MASLADLPELVGFFSYSREDDAGAFGALSALRERIQHELRAQLGRTAKTFRIWQDKEAIPSGTLWEGEITNSVAQAVFFIPIVTPTVVASPYCRFELDSFLAREAALGRTDLVFPILYIHVPALEDSARRQNDAVLSLIAKRQYVDWRELRHLDSNSTEVRRAVERFCGHIRDALNKPWLSPEALKRQEEAAALERAEAERQRQAAEAKRRAEEEARQRATEEERQKREAEAERDRLAALEARAREEEVRERQRAQAQRRSAEEHRLREETEAKRRAEAEERRRLRRSQARPLWPPSRPALAAVSLLGIVLLGAIGVWLARSPGSVPVGPVPVGPVPVGPVPVAPTPTASPTAIPTAPVAPAPAAVTPTPPARPTPQPVAPAPPARVQATPTRQAAYAPLSPVQERALKPGDAFQECSKCPVMKVVPAGHFMMGSQGGGWDSPQHIVTFNQPLAVGQFEITFDEWAACVDNGGCNDYVPSDNGWGRGRRPVIFVSWEDANAYVVWLSKITGKTYRLLSEAEYEYAERAGTTTTYPWGDDIKLKGQAMANCDACGSDWDNKQTAPVGSFAPNGFGLYDMAGNVDEWTQDCWNDSYYGAPTDGSAWTTGDCSNRVLRGGTWYSDPDLLESDVRSKYEVDLRFAVVGFRVARTLLTR